MITLFCHCVYIYITFTRYVRQIGILYNTLNQIFRIRKFQTIPLFTRKTVGNWCYCLQAVGIVCAKIFKQHFVTAQASIPSYELGSVTFPQRSGYSTWVRGFESRQRCDILNISGPNI